VRSEGWSLDLDGSEDVGGTRGRVSLRIPDTTSDNSSTDETGRSDGNTSQSDRGKKGRDGNGHLLRSVGEVVVTSGHEVEGTN